MSAARAYPLYEPTASLAANDHTHAPERPSRSALHCNRFTGSIADIPRGNIRKKVLGTRSVTMSYDARNRLSAANDTGETGNRALSYDTRGNVTWLGGQNFTYNAMNRPTSMGGDVDAVHRYDGHGRRIRTVTYPDEGGYIIRYNVFGATGDLIFNVQIDKSAPDDEESESSGDYVTTMVKMDGQTIARVKSEGRVWNYTDTVTYLHNDHLGSAGSGTKADGTIAWREEYSPFGMTLINDAANDNQAGFTGHIKDSDTGLNYMQARYYDPVIGRFLSVDPMGMMDMDLNPGYFNRYTYAMNDSVNMIDPDGEKVWGWAVARVSGSLKKQAVLHSKEQAIKAANSGKDILSASGRASAKSVAKTSSPGRRVVREDPGHVLRDGSGATGLPHFHNGKGSHIFWGTIVPAVVAVLDFAEQLDPFYVRSLDGGCVDCSNANDIDQQWRELRAASNPANDLSTDQELPRLDSDLSTATDRAIFSSCQGSRIGNSGTGSIC